MTVEPVPAHDADSPSVVLAQVLALVLARAVTLAERLRGDTTVVDFITLLQLNRTLVELRHLQALGNVTFESLHRATSALASDLETLSSPSRRVEDVPVYDPSAPQASLLALMKLLRHRLGAAEDPVHVQEVPLEEHRYGIRTATIGSPLAQDGSDRLIFMATSAMLPDALRAWLPSLMKVSHPQHLRDVVNLHQPGLTVHPMQTVPPRVPHLADASYFEIDLSGDTLTQRVRLDGRLALHIAGDIPELHLTLWVVRNQQRRS